MTLSIALDAMGGDHGISVVAAAAKLVIKRNKKVKLILVGNETELSEELSKLGVANHPQLIIQHASQKVEMDESPALALRNKKDSSMRVAINMVKSGEAQACVSAGNTGALMATARFVLKTLPGIDRPAICTALPSMRGHTHVLDLGANIDSNSDVLMQFAVMGAIAVAAVDGNDSPLVGLLNVGEEDIKGSDTIKEASRLIANSGLNYHGFIEGDDVFKGTVDVVVCDGFVGNVMLKSSEGLARMVFKILKEEFSRSIFKKLSALIALPVLKGMKHRLDPGRYNGASLLGLQGIVVKSHGGADAPSFAAAIDVAIKEVDNNVPERIAAQVEEFLLERRVS